MFGWGVLMLVAVGPLVPAKAVDGVRILQSSPACVQKKLGQVSVSLGNKEPNPRTGMAPTPVSYKKVFARLAQAAQEKGGDAVVLRGHDAGFVTKGARIARRPTYLSLQGAVLVLDDARGDCALALVDPAHFEREALQRERQDIVKDTGLSF
jgi:hypothetical protein